MAAAAATKEPLWLRKLMNNLRQTVSTVPIWADTHGAVKLLKNPITPLRSKHIDVIYHFAREKVARKEVAFEYVKTEHMLADYLTKLVPEGKHAFCCSGMGVSNDTMLIANTWFLAPEHSSQPAWEYCYAVLPDMLVQSVIVFW